ncbi:hypothetical protein pipiens_004058 [Culex pipiens pipiens]|uniref:Uncharacterized protein n=1 Tax=Culex pipiens pipiens TaxID=38569 RepID=A0ABD1CP88_CULPP
MSYDIIKLTDTGVDILRIRVDQLEEANLQYQRKIAILLLEKASESIRIKELLAENAKLEERLASSRAQQAKLGQDFVILQHRHGQLDELYSELREDCQEQNQVMKQIRDANVDLKRVNKIIHEELIRKLEQYTIIQRELTEIRQKGDRICKVNLSEDHVKRDVMERNFIRYKLLTNQCQQQQKNEKQINDIRETVNVEMADLQEPKNYYSSYSAYKKTGKSILSSTESDGSSEDGDKKESKL